MKTALKDAATAARAAQALPPDLLERYGCGPIQFSGDPNASYERHLVFDHVVRPGDAAPRERFEALARSLRDLLSQRWLKTGETYDRENPKQVYYLSMEFLIGRSLSNNLVNLLVEPFVREAARGGRAGPRPSSARRSPTPGSATAASAGSPPASSTRWPRSQIPAIGYGLRYEYGIFRQEIEDGRQVEQPDHWLRRPDPWEVDRPAEAVDVRVDCAVRSHGGAPVLIPDAPTVLRGVPYDRPVVGYGGRTVNTLRLWGAAATGRLRLRRVQRRRLLRRGPREGRGRDPHPRPLPRRLHPRRRGAAVRPGVLPRLLLARRHRPPVPAAEGTTGRPSPTRSPSSSTTPTRRWPSPS